MRKLLEKKSVRLTLGLYGLLVAAIVLYALLGRGDGLPAEFPAPQFDLEEVMNGDEPVSLERNIGRPLLLYFFASW